MGLVKRLETGAFLWGQVAPHCTNVTHTFIYFRYVVYECPPSPASSSSSPSHPSPHSSRAAAASSAGSPAPPPPPRSQRERCRRLISVDHRQMTRRFRCTPLRRGRARSHAFSRQIDGGKISCIVLTINSGLSAGEWRPPSAPRPIAPVHCPAALAICRDKGARQPTHSSLLNHLIRAIPI